jgi:hypothetical protein
MNSTTNKKDQTIAELHQIRREISEKFQGDLFAINADARARMEQSGRVVIPHVPQEHSKANAKSP